MQKEARMEPHINKICLAEDISEVNTTACVINGWGVNGFGEFCAFFDQFGKSASMQNQYFILHFRFLHVHKA